MVRRRQTSRLLLQPKWLNKRNCRPQLGAGQLRSACQKLSPSGPGNLGAQALQLRLHPSPPSCSSRLRPGKSGTGYAYANFAFSLRRKTNKNGITPISSSAAGLLDLRETVNHSHWAHMDVADEISDNDVELASKLDLVPSRASTVLARESSH